MSNGGRVTTELDIELAKLKLKAEEAKAEFRKMSKAAEDTKLGEKLEAGMKKSTVNEFRGFKERAEKAAAEAAVAAAAKWKEIVTPAVTDSWRVQKSTFAGGGGGSGSGKFQAGMLGQQLQDIAVQAQMGVSPITILAQQGSQLAGIFGTGGAIVGAGIAVGGALMTMGVKGNEAFEGLIQRGKDLHDEIVKIVDSGSLDQLLEAFDKVEKQNTAISAERKSIGSVGGAFSGGWGMIMGGKSEAEKLNDLKKAEIQAQWDLVNAEQVALLISERQIKVNELRAKGKDAEADALERQLKLEAQIERIRGSNMSPEVKKELEANVRESARLEDLKTVKDRDATNDKKWEQDAEKRISALSAYAEAEHAVEVASMTAAEKLVDLNRQRLDLERQIKAESDDEKKLQLATERERIEAQIVTSQTATAKEAENAEKARQERISGLQKELAGKEKSLAKLENPTPTQTFRAAGALSSQFDWMFGGSSALVSESTNQNTDAMKDLKEEIKALRGKLGDLNINTTSVFAP